MDLTLLSAVVSAFAGLFGAIIGAVGSYFVQRKHFDDLRRQRIVEKYLYQLGEAIYSLKARRDNLEKDGIEQAKAKLKGVYFLQSTLYALGTVWAYERIFLRDGIYHELDQIEKGRGSDLLDLLKSLSNIRGLWLYRRMILYELLIVEEESSHGILPYVEFKRRLNDPFNHHALQPVIEWLQGSGKVDPKNKLPELEEKVSQLIVKLGGTDRYVKLAGIGNDHN